MNPDWKNPCGMDGRRLDFGRLGGTSTQGDPDSWYPEMWTWLLEMPNIRTVLDVGCGVGFAQKFFHGVGCTTYGIDCQQVLQHHLLGLESGLVEPYDLVEGAWQSPVGQFDLVWCCEVAEHIAPECVQNVIDTLANNTKRVLALCAAPSGAGGHNHVNCQDPPYWIEKLEAAGLEFQPYLTACARNLCPEAYGRSQNNYFRRSGLIFTRKQQ